MLELIWVVLCLNCCIGVHIPQDKLKKQPISVCQKLNIDNLFIHKATVDKKLHNTINIVKHNKKISNKAKQYRLQAINVFQREMNDSVTSLYNSVENLKSFLKGDFRSIQKLKETSKKRLEQLKTSMLKAEEEFNQIIEAEKEEQTETMKNKKNKNYDTVIKKFVHDMIGDVAIAADKLEGELNADSFEHGIREQNGKIDIETVIKVGGKEMDGGEDTEGVIMLIDSESNHFVLAKPKDSTITHVDHIFLKEIMYLLMLSFMFTLVCNLCKLPSIFACILSGVILGPSGYGYIKSIVQIETIGEFGVFFTLFSVGLEFSPDKLRKVLREAVTGTISTMLLFVLIGLFWGTVFGILPRQSFFVTLCLSFSSTPMVSKFLDNYKKSKKPSQEHENGISDDYWNLLFSMLFLQDSLLGLFMAVLPILAGHAEKGHSFAHVPVNRALHDWFHGTFGGPAEELFFTLVELAFALMGICFMAFVISKYLAAKVFRGLSLFGSHETLVFGISTLLFTITMLTEYFGVSMELGCFICGGIVGTMGEQTVKQVSVIVEPLKDFFAALFFASIGFHIFPSFVFSEIAIFIPITLLVISTKFLLTSTVLHQLLPIGNQSKWLVAAGLAQISEFSFVLGSRARRYGLIGREVYLTILSVTTLSLFLSPLVWRTVHSSVLHKHSWNMKSIIKRLKLPH
ncbi:transmembrane and coiled-coil domain-containing protein 3-like isoform X1 [Hydractinia symbiolongicarpus]|uniref:transmembrane and coiled-coil domain-containing protein 3-like isoform X1 n=1 Tax=Hydractinia symbiolongicarpus TaxID=13093 RepID=UPI00254DDC01|nr:transmembrane and coiled-coil domain-containing protein 3-like isoform X1 [Hydractinia symbiolongicarpus]